MQGMMNPGMMGQISPELLKAMTAQPSAPQSMNPQMGRPQGPGPFPGGQPQPGGAPMPPMGQGQGAGGPSMQQVMQMLAAGGQQRAPYMPGGGM